MGTVVLLNIDGVIYNVANIVRVKLLEANEHRAGLIEIVTVEDVQSFKIPLTPASRAAYEWLKSLAVDPVLAMGHIEPEKS